MCQIFHVQEGGNYPSQEQVDLEEEKNQDGCGVMWFEKHQGVNKVFWEKGLTAKEAFKLFKKVPLPAAFHMRNTTIGGDDKKLTHPFAVSKEKDIQLALKGSASDAIMHNGTWHAWKDVFKYRAFDTKEKIPRGPWSDSRAMAYLGAVNGIGLYDVIDISDGRLLWYDAGEGVKGWCWKWGNWIKGDGYIYSAALQVKPSPKIYTPSSFVPTSSKFEDFPDRIPKVNVAGSSFWTTEEIMKIKCELHAEAHLRKLMPMELVERAKVG